MIKVDRNSDGTWYVKIDETYQFNEYLDMERFLQDTMVDVAMWGNGNVHILDEGGK
jgi:hypothetical protein